MTRGGWKAPLTHSKGTDLAITSEPEKSLSDKSSDKLPPVFAGLDKAEALEMSECQNRSASSSRN